MISYNIKNYITISCPDEMSLQDAVAALHKLLDVYAADPPEDALILWREKRWATDGAYLVREGGPHVGRMSNRAWLKDENKPSISSIEKMALDCDSTEPAVLLYQNSKWVISNYIGQEEIADCYAMAIAGYNLYWKGKGSPIIVRMEGFDSEETIAYVMPR